MKMKKLETWQEWLEAERISATAFLRRYDEEKSKREYIEQAEGKRWRNEDAWGCFDDRGEMISSLILQCEQRMLDGREVRCGEVFTVATYPEARERGAVRELLRTAHDEMLARDYLFATLYPFSFPYYRRYGYETAASPMTCELPMDELEGFPRTFSAKEMRTELDIRKARDLYESFVRDKNLGMIRPAHEWQLREDGGFGRRSYFTGDKTEYAYLLSDASGKERAYLKFSFESSKDHFMVGTLRAGDVVFDDPEALRELLGFIHKMRAMCVRLSIRLPEHIDIATLVPNPDRVQRSLSSVFMARVLDVKRALETIRYPRHGGSFTIKVTDDFLPANSGYYTVNYFGTVAVSVKHSDFGEADIEVDIQTFSQMVIGMSSLKAARYKPGTKVRANEEILEKVFIDKETFA